MEKYMPVTHTVELIKSKSKSLKLTPCCKKFIHFKADQHLYGKVYRNGIEREVGSLKPNQ